MGVDRNYLRVPLHRTKDKFKDEWAILAPVYELFQGRLGISC